jgi:Ca2+/Na+ antiporter
MPVTGNNGKIPDSGDNIKSTCYRIFALFPVTSIFVFFLFVVFFYCSLYLVFLYIPVCCMFVSYREQKNKYKSQETDKEITRSTDHKEQGIMQKIPVTKNNRRNNNQTTFCIFLFVVCLYCSL